jgi:hypothetical protein
MGPAPVFSSLLYILKLMLLKGGIIALGLFKRDWNVDGATAHFMNLSNEAFHPRGLLKVPGFKDVAQMFCSYRYSSEGIENALQRAFGKGPLYGQRRDAIADPVKVGVVAAITANNRPYIFANYSRNPTDRK